MMRMSGKQLLHVVAAWACLWLAGCAGPGGLFASGESTPPFSDPAMGMQSASALIVPGTSSKADVGAALGKATVVTFDSGYEVWVYRKKSNEPLVANAEFVVLFAPSGIVKKTRIRPAYEVRRD